MVKYLKGWFGKMLCSRLAVAVILLCTLNSCGAGKKAYDASRKFSPDALQEDAEKLWQTLQQCHPSLYWYTSKDSLDAGFENMIASLQDSLTEQQFRVRLSKAVAMIRCGHTSVQNSKASAHSHKRQRQPFFPLQVKTWGGDSMVILANAYGKDSVLKRGTSIQSINGVPVKTIVDSICPYISADGLHNNFRYQLISNNFPAWYKAIFGLSDEYELAVTTQEGIAMLDTIKNFDPVIQDSIRKAQDSVARRVQPGKKHRIHRRFRRLEDDRKLTIDTANSLALMELNTFSHAHLGSFYRKSFRKMKQRQIENLVIELRENGGGNIINSTRLDRYISDHKFRVADTAFAKSLRYPYPGMIKNGWFYQVQSWFGTRKKKDGMRHFKIYERKYFKPYKNNHFDGQVYVITGGFTFSASTLFITPIKGQRNVLVLGEETGGGAYGNSAVNVPDIVLPNTGVRVRLPLYRLVINSKLPHDGRGIIPDIEVAPTSWHLAHRQDPKMEKVYELVRQQKAKH